MLDGKICVVTGSGSGIGRATAVEMARQGAGGVVVSDINDESGHETVELIRAAGGDAHYLHCDMTSEADISALIAGTVSHVRRARRAAQQRRRARVGLHDQPLGRGPAARRLREGAADQSARPLARDEARGPAPAQSTRAAAIINAGSTGGVTGYPAMNAYGAAKGG